MLAYAQEAEKGETEHNSIAGVIYQWVGGFALGTFLGFGLQVRDFYGIG